MILQGLSLPPTPSLVSLSRHLYLIPGRAQELFVVILSLCRSQPPGEQSPQFTHPCRPVPHPPPSRCSRNTGGMTEHWTPAFLGLSGPRPQALAQVGRQWHTVPGTVSPPPSASTELSGSKGDHASTREQTDPAPSGALSSTQLWPFPGRPRSVPILPSLGLSPPLALSLRPAEICSGVTPSRIPQESASPLTPPRGSHDALQLLLASLSYPSPAPGYSPGSGGH